MKHWPQLIAGCGRRSLQCACTSLTLAEGILGCRRAAHWAHLLAACTACIRLKATAMLVWNVPGTQPSQLTTGPFAAWTHPACSMSVPLVMPYGVQGLTVQLAAVRPLAMVISQRCESRPEALPACSGTRLMRWRTGAPASAVLCRASATPQKTQSAGRTWSMQCALASASGLLPSLACQVPLPVQCDTGQQTCHVSGQG